MGFPGSSAGKESACNARDPGSISGSGKSPGEGIGYPLKYSWSSLVAQMVKNLPAMWEIWVGSLGQEDPLEKGMAVHSSILAWRIPWTEEPGGLRSMGSQRVGYDWATNTHTQTHITHTTHRHTATTKWTLWHTVHFQVCFSLDSELVFTKIVIEQHILCRIKIVLFSISFPCESC